MAKQANQPKSTVITEELIKQMTNQPYMDTDPEYVEEDPENFQPPAEKF